MDQAKGILAFIQTCHVECTSFLYSIGRNILTRGMVDTIMADLVRYEMRPESLTKETVDTLSTISEIVGKSIRTLLRTISLLKLSDEIQAAIRNEGCEW